MRLWKKPNRAVLVAWLLVAAAHAQTVGREAARERDFDWLTSYREPGQPAISPDGGKVAFSLFESDPPRGWVRRIRVAMGADRPPVAVSEGPWDTDPVFLPNGDVVYMALRPVTVSMMRVGAGGGKPQQLAALPGRPTARPRVSPDGSWAAMALEDPEGGRSRLIAVPLSGGRFRVLATVAGTIRGIAFAPAGGHLCYAVKEALSGSSALDRVGLDGQPPETLFSAEGDLFLPFFTPRGSRLLCFHRSPGAMGTPDLWFLEMSGQPGPPHLESKAALMAPFACELSGNLPAFADEGSLIAEVFHGGGIELARIQMASGSLEILDPGGASDHSPDVAPNGAVAWIREGFARPPDIHIGEPSGRARRATDLHAAWIGPEPLQDLGSLPLDLPGATSTEIHVLRATGPSKGRGGLLLLDGSLFTLVTRRFDPRWHYLAAQGLSVVHLRPSGSDAWWRDEPEAAWSFQRNYQEAIAAMGRALPPEGEERARWALFGWGYGAALGAWLATQTDLFDAALVSPWGDFWRFPAVTGWDRSQVSVGAQGIWTSLKQALDESARHGLFPLRTATAILAQDALGAGVEVLWGDIASTLARDGVRSKIIVSQSSAFEVPAHAATLRQSVEWILREGVPRPKIEPRGLQAFEELQLTALQLRALHDIALINRAVQEYMLDFEGVAPARLVELIEPLPDREFGYLDLEELPLDPWDREYVYKAGPEPQDYLILTYGADGVEGGVRDDSDLTHRDLERYFVGGAGNR